MKTTFISETAGNVQKRFSRYLCMLAGSLLLYTSVSARRDYKDGIGETDSVIINAAAAEKKVDYLERIYFSGKNKEEMHTMILATIQELDEKPATLAVAKQYAFLSGIKDQAEEAGNACDVAEMLAAGIYAIDANAALQKNIDKPGDSNKKKAGNGLSVLDGLSNTTNTTNDAAYTAWYLSNGNIKAFNTVNKLGRAAGALGTGKKVFDEGKKVFKALGLGGGKKPCSKIKQQDIEIGAHIVPDTNKPVVAVQVKPVAISETVKTIVIKNITYSQLQTLGSAMEKVPGITTVNSDKFESNTATIVFNSDLKMKEIITKMIESNKALKFNIENASASEANLLVTK